MRRRVRRFKRERLAGLLGVPFLIAVPLVFGALAIFSEVLLCRIGCAIVSISFAYTAYRFLRANWRLSPSVDNIRRYREYLVHRRDAFQGFLLWSSLPAALGVALAILGWLRSEPSDWPDAAMAAGFWAGLQVAFWAGNRNEVATLQREIDFLSAHN
jgi:hypothetical protein